MYTILTSLTPGFIHLLSWRVSRKKLVLGRKFREAYRTEALRKINTEKE